MRLKIYVVFVLLGPGIVQAGAQGFLSDLMSGKLVAPEVGAFAWYNLTDTTTGRQFFLRQAIVGEERVKRKDAYWLETELIPKVGFSSVYKMLLTGPASNPKNVHRLIVREGQGPVQEVEVDRSAERGDKIEAPRESRGTESVELPGRTIVAERFVVEEDGKTTEIWVSEEVRPMGLVRMKTEAGELMLQRFGTGGKDGESALPGLQPDGEDAEEPEEKPGPRTNFHGRRKR